MSVSRPVVLSMVIGDPVDHSLSPMLHNTGYKILGIDSHYYYFNRKVSEERLKNVMDAVKTLQIRGVSVTAPLKQKIIEYLDDIDESASVIGAVNTVVNTDGRLKGYNTDWIGVIAPLRETVVDLRDKNVAIIGAGGAARAAVYAMRDAVQSVTIFNRSLERAESIARDFNVEIRSLVNITNINEFDIVILTVPGDSNHLIKKELRQYLRQGQLLFNFAYSPDENIFLHDLESMGLNTIDGYEMLFSQALEQFRLFTGKRAPAKELKSAMRTFVERSHHD